MALADNEVVQEVLREFKLSAPDLKTSIEESAPRGESRPRMHAVSRLAESDLGGGNG